MLGLLSKQKCNLFQLNDRLLSDSNCFYYISFPGSLVAQTVKNLPAMWETSVQPLGWEDSLEKGMATYSSFLSSRIPMDRGAWRAAVHGAAKSQTMTEQLNAHTCITSNMFSTSTIFQMVSNLVLTRLCGFMKMMKMEVAQLCPTLWSHELNSPEQNTGVGNRSLLQGIFPTQGSNLGLLLCRWILYQLSQFIDNL